jgi:hypothetical protein
MRNTRLRLGLFVPPFHALNDNPTLCYERDLDLAETLMRSASLSFGTESITRVVTRLSRHRS